MALTPIRRVVTGNDERARSKVVWDGPAPGTHETNFKGRGHTDFWVWRGTAPPPDGIPETGKRGRELPRPPGGGPPRALPPAAAREGRPPHPPQKEPQQQAR